MVHWLRMFFTIHVSCFWGTFHTWDCSCEHSLGCTRTFECGGCPSMQQSWLSLPFVFVCLFYDLLSFLFHCRFAFEINIALDERSFVCASRFPRACVSERQISRVFWTLRNSRFPKFADQNHIRSNTFRPKFTLESISYSPDFKGYLKNFVSQIRYAARRDNVCLLSPSKGIKWRAILRSFHRNEFVRKVVLKYRIPSFPCNITTIELVFRSWCFGFPPILSPHRIFLLGRVSFNNVNLVK